MPTKVSRKHFLVLKGGGGRYAIHECIISSRAAPRKRRRGKARKKEKPRRLIHHICISTFSFVTPLPRRIMNRFMIIRYFLLTVDMSPVKTQPVSSEQQRQVETWSAIFDYSNHRFPTEQTMTIGKLHRCLPPPPPLLPTAVSGSHSDARQPIEPLFYSPLPTVQFSISSSSSFLECGCQDHLAPPSD